MKILLVDDDELFSNLLKASLTEQRYTVDTAVNGQDGWDFVEAQNYDLIVLDVMLPKLDGISFCRRLRANRNQTLVMLLTARATSDEKVMGLDAGADDYVVKPIPLPELEARIRALLRREQATVSPVLEWGKLQLDPSQCEVTYNGVSLNLTAKEYALLELFMRNSQKIHGASSILNQLWSFEDEPPTPDTVRALIKRLRQKLKAVGADDLVETVYGLGYRLNPALPHVQEKEFVSNTEHRRSLSKATNWEETKSSVLEQIALLEQATGELSDISQKKARDESHKLIGSLGILGLPQGCEIARQIETLLEPQVSLEGQQELNLSVQKLRLLVENAPPLHQEKQATKQPQIETQTRLLIVDEDREFIDRLVVKATSGGMQTAIASNPKLALEAINRVRPDIVLLDMSHPDRREDGLMLLDELSKHTPPIPVLVFTSYNQATDRVAVARRKVRGFLEKPIVPSQVLEVITQILKPSRTTEARVLVVDDDRMTLRFVQTLLEPWGLQVTTLSNPLEFWDELEAVTPDLVVLDIQMPDIDGIELCQMLRNDSRWAWLPIVFLTGQRDAETIQKVFAAGADDYVSKPIVAPELITRIFNRLERTRLLREYAEIEPLTGLPNRHRSSEDLSKFLQIAKQYQQPFCLAVITLDNLTQINRKFGHQLGDQMLRRLAHLLRQELRNEDIVARWDGAEFIVGMYGMNRSDGVEWLAEVLELLRQIKLESDAQLIQMSFSSGVTQYPLDGSDIQTLYQVAGEVLEKARKFGSDRILPANWQPVESNKTDIILLHQDSFFATSILRAMETRGYHTQWFQDGKTALDALAVNNPIHSRVILVEDNLPLRDGLDVLKQFKRDKITQRSRVVWLSSNLSEVEKAKSLGCFDYINLPCNVSAFMNRLRQALES
ncbi:MAG: response regulator [Cyanomargarita calcarea GSE-NOS-MK-12-04C]|jgi:diguanylate cyclase (GGDEF)-like protein|uniref:Response regulator n=1 Tax=Cyanomargarita calcarea GSE-NOS-MK-12-04C TaxID=2839659 RepID=A0A951UWR8_9CYAN|nr:response regulator [Cyanomargarita calcarea GSE-NOS-MK-12-04C]